MHYRTLAIDPGTRESAWVVLSDDEPIRFGKTPNEELIKMIRPSKEGIAAEKFAIEMVESQGMAVGREVFETVYWIGRFVEAWKDDTTARRIGRKAVCGHICGSGRAKDANIRQAVIDKFGGETVAIGKVKCVQCKGRKLVGLGKKRGDCPTCEGSGWKHPPGPLAEITADVWSALAVAITSEEIPKESPNTSKPT